MMPKSFVLVAAALLLSACHSTPDRHGGTPRESVAGVGQVQLHWPLAIPAGHSRVFLQQGQIVEKNGLRRYQPHCNFEQRVVSQGDSVIRPETFAVTAVVFDEEEVVRRHSPLRQVALQPVSDLDMVLLSRYVAYTLHSARQPGVMRLTCHGGFAEPWQVRYPTLAEMEAALGENASLELKR